MLRVPEPLPPLAAIVLLGALALPAQDGPVRAPRDMRSLAALLLAIDRYSLEQKRPVTLPLLRPGIVAGLMLVLLSGLKEVPLTLLLAPPGYSTLATELWDAAREAFYAQAAVPAALLLLVSFVSVGLLVRHGDIEA